METTRFEPQFTEHLRGLWHVRWWALGAALIAGALVFALRQSADDVYEADARLRVSLREGSSLLASEEETEFAAVTYAALADSPEVLRDAIDRSRLPISLAEAESRVGADTGDTPGYIDVTATGPTPRDAAALAGAMARALVGVIQDDQEAEGGARLVTASIVAGGRASSQPVSPRPLQEAGLAFLVTGLVAAEAGVLARSARGRLSLGDPARQVEELLGVPAICVRRVDSRESAGDAVLDVLPFFLHHLASRRIVTVVGTDESAAAAMLLAEAAATAGRRSILVDMDMRRPVLDGAPGLAEVLLGEARPVDVAMRSADGRALVMSAGARGDSAVALLASEDLRTCVEDFGADTAVISTTAASPRLESMLVVLRFPDAIVLSADPTRVSRRQLVRISTELRDLGKELRAVVLVPGRRHRLGAAPSQLRPLADPPPEVAETERPRALRA